MTGPSAGPPVGLSAGPSDGPSAGLSGGPAAEVGEVVRLALGDRPRPAADARPSVTFEDRLGGHFGTGPDGTGPDGTGPDGTGPDGTGPDSTGHPGGAVAEPIPPGEPRRQAEEQLREALDWCSARFPLRLRDGDDPEAGGIHEFGLGRSAGSGRLVSSSSPDLPGVVFLGAPWPLPFVHRVASVVAHENVHQELYRREAAGRPFRDGSLGYSPWKDTVRPGRWVWHAYWTFACQVALLADALAADPSLPDVDADLPGFVADLDARVGVCLYSLSLFDVVPGPELERCTDARAVLDGLVSRLDDDPRFGRERAAALDRSHARMARWAGTVVPA